MLFFRGLVRLRFGFGTRLAGGRPGCGGEISDTAGSAGDGVRESTRKASRASGIFGMIFRNSLRHRGCQRLIDLPMDSTCSGGSTPNLSPSQIQRKTQIWVKIGACAQDSSAGVMSLCASELHVSHRDVHEPGPRLAEHDAREGLPVLCRGTALGTTHRLAYAEKQLDRAPGSWL